MTPIDRDGASRRARPGVPFSNGTEWECWSARWCGCCARDAFASYGAGCPLITIALAEERTPAEWIEQPGFRLGDQYQCLEYRPRGGGDPSPRPRPEPDQPGLFERPTRATRMLHPLPQTEGAAL